MENLILISKQNSAELSHKKGRRNKNREFYNWRIERFNSNNPAGIFMDVTPMIPSANGIQRIKSAILSAINSRNIFDFPYQPEDGDILYLKHFKYQGDFLELQFLNKEWHEHHTFTIDTKYRAIAEGNFELV